MPSLELGGSIPPDTAHAVSVSLPTWSTNVGYEEGQAWVVDKMTTGYPRFFIHKSIDALSQTIVAKYGRPGQKAFLYPSPKVARSCVAFLRPRVPPETLDDITVVDLALDVNQQTPPSLKTLSPTVSAVIIPAALWSLGKEYWQHTGDGISSRRAEFCQTLLEENLLLASSAAGSSPRPSQPRSFRGPKRYQRQASIDDTQPVRSKSPSPPADAIKETQESTRFLEERFGRNLDLSLLEPARSAIRRRIAGSLTHEIDLQHGQAEMGPSSRGVAGLEEHDVYLFPAGMNAIYNAHKALLAARGPLKSVSVGFPYVDTLKVLQKFGPGCHFYGHASSEELDDLEKRLRDGEKLLALFCEFPGNPLLACPDLDRIRKLADEFDFAVVVDETIGTFANINVLGVVDVVVSSLTKIFSGDSNVMGGGLVLNPKSKYYTMLKQAMQETYEDTYWAEDVIFMERNSRDFMSRIDRVNANAEAICDILVDSPLVETVYYPKHNPTRPHYEARRLPSGGYGGLLSVVFKKEEQAKVFYDVLETAKGPSLGTNFTLVSPYVLLAHYQELDWAASYGVAPHLIRMSVGLEETAALCQKFSNALEAAAAVAKGVE